MRIFYVAVAAALVTALAAPAHAQLLPGGFYIGVQGGWTKLEDVTNQGHPTGGPFAGQNSQSLESFNDGFNVGGRAGFKMGRGAWKAN